MRVHAIEVGRLVTNETFIRGESLAAVLRRVVPLRFSAYAFVVEHPDGPIVVDTGMNARAWPVPGPVFRVVPKGELSAEEEIGPAMRARGLDPDAVRTVVLTHLDTDHVGGIGHFPTAEALVHRPEHAYAHSFAGRRRERPQDWPDSFRPTLYDLDSDPYGPFPASRAVREGVRIVPLAGHTPGQIGVVVEDGEDRLLLAGDHTMSQDDFLADRASGRLTNMGFAARQAYAETQRRVERFVAERPTVLLPAHDPDVPARVESRDPVLA